MLPPCLAQQSHRLGRKGGVIRVLFLVLWLIAEQCGAGVAHTKLLAKLCSGLNKPNMQTVLPSASVPQLLADLPLSKLRGLGGQYGQQVQERLSITTAGVSDLTHLSFGWHQLIRAPYE